MTEMKLRRLLAFSVLVLLGCTMSAQDRPTAITSPARTIQSTTKQPTITLVSPPWSQTGDSIAIVWDKPSCMSVAGYDVYVNSAIVSTTQNTDYTLKDLSAARGYDISVRARLTTGNSLKSNSIRVATKPRSDIFDITTYGAAGDGKTLNTVAIQAAIDACSPGGVVRIPKGVFLSGAIFLKSEMTLHLDQDAVLLGSPDTRDYPLMKYRFEGRESTCYASLVNTPAIKTARWRDITIDGPGTINASGSVLRKKELKEAAGKTGRAVCIRDTDHVYLQSVTVRQSPSWCVHLIYCNGVSVNGVTINTRYDQAGKNYTGIVNGDGLDPDSCRDVFIFNSEFTTEDDCISLKSGRDAEGRAVGLPTENVRISNCQFTSGFGVALGSEMAGGIRNVMVEDCCFKDTHSIASIKAIRGRGNVIENITFGDCTYTNKNPAIHDSQWSHGVLYIDQFYGDAKFNVSTAKPKDETTPLIRNVLFKNITLDTAGGNAIYLTGLAESPLENIRLINVTASGEHGFIANNIRGLVLENVSIHSRDGIPRRFTNVQ